MGVCYSDDIRSVRAVLWTRRSVLLSLRRGLPRWRRFAIANGRWRCGGLKQALSGYSSCEKSGLSYSLTGMSLCFRMSAWRDARTSRGARADGGCSQGGDPVGFEVRHVLWAGSRWSSDVAVAASFRADKVCCRRARAGNVVGTR